MKSLIWPVMAVAVLGALDLRNGAGVAPVSTVPAGGDTTAGAPPEALRSAMAHLGEEVRPGGDGTLAIANGSYRASFSAAAGVVYTPRHGDGLVARLTWRYRARAIATDTVTRALDAVAPAVSATGDHVVDFVRPGLIERYEGERAGVEQIFVLSERPAGRGDVRIVGDVGFDGTIRAKDGGLEFDAGDGLPLFTYARPIAFDARRKPVPVRVEVAGTALSLVLDGAALDRVQWPVTIDPLFGTTVVEPLFGGFGAGVAYNARRGEFLVVYCGWDTGVDSVVRARRYRDYGDAVGPSYALTTTDASFVVWANVAYDLASDRYFAVWTEGPGTPSPIQAKGVLLDPSGVPLAPVLSFAAGLPSQEAFQIRVAARNLRDHQADDAAFLAVWTEGESGESGEGVYRQRVTGTGVKLEAAKVSAGPAGSPVVTFDPHTDRFVIGYAEGESVRVRTVSAANGLAALPIEISPYGGTLEGIAYDVASRRSLLVWKDGEPESLWGQLLASGQTPAPVGGPFLVRQGVSDVIGAAVASEVGTFVVQQELHTSNDAGLVEVQRYRADGLSLGTTLLDGALNFAMPGGIAFGFHGYTPSTYARLEASGGEQVIALVDRWFARYVHGGNAGDFDGDTRSDLFCYRPATGRVYVRTTSGESSYVFANLNLPIRSGVPALLDYDGDGLTDISLWVPGTGTWWIRQSSDQQLVKPVLGRAGDFPVPGDYHGLGEDQIAIFRPSTATWIVETTRLPTAIVPFGQLGDLPVPADWNGDGDIELGVWRPSTGVWYAAELDGTPVPIPSTPWGQAGDIPLAGQFTGTATADQVVYRRQLGVIFRRDGASGAMATISVGQSGIPTPLDWDGNGRLEPTLFDASSGGWKINDSTNTWVTFGSIGDIPAGAR